MKAKGRVLGKARDLVLTPAQRDKLPELTTGKGGNQDLFRTLEGRVRTTSDGKIVVRVYDVEMERLEALAARDDEGTWQKWAREVLAANS